MARFESLKDQIAGAGGNLLYVAAEKRKGFFKPEKYLTEHPVSFPFLLDQDREVIKRYGLYHRLGTDAFNIAHPATLVVDRGGVIRFVYRGDGQADRAPLEQVLDALRKLQASG
jgi:peroxiredoxin